MTPSELSENRLLRSAAMREARENAMVTKQDLSTRTGVSRQTIDRIERGGTWGVDVEILYLTALGMVHFQPIYKIENGKRVITKMVLMPREK